MPNNLQFCRIYAHLCVASLVLSAWPCENQSNERTDSLAGRAAILNGGALDRVVSSNGGALDRAVVSNGGALNCDIVSNGVSDTDREQFSSSQRDSTA